MTGTQCIINVGEHIYFLYANEARRGVVIQVSKTHVLLGNVTKAGEEPASYRSFKRELMHMISSGPVNNVPK